MSNVELQKASKKAQINTQLVIFSNQVLNKINFTKIINAKSCQLPLKGHKTSCVFKYLKNLGKIIFSYNSLSKNSS